MYRRFFPLFLIRLWLMSSYQQCLNINILNVRIPCHIRVNLDNVEIVRHFGVTSCSEQFACNYVSKFDSTKRISIKRQRRFTKIWIVQRVIITWSFHYLLLKMNWCEKERNVHNSRHLGLENMRYQLWLRGIFVTCVAVNQPLIFF